PDAPGASIWGSADDCPPRKSEVRPLVAPLEVVLSRGVRVRGEVVDGRGSRVPMVMVSPVPEGITIWSDPEGRFDTVVPAGTRAMLARSGSRVGRSALPAEGGPVRIVLVQGEAFLEVVVVDGDGEPLPGVRVTVEGDNAIGDTDGQGHARLGPLVPGRYRVVLPGTLPIEGETGVPVRIAVAK
ncbi:MAG TPA: carboxypeptidase-like regulatory domain-containing protein, partial [Planctomycetota bacterium]|nr:carboxypeptidase-like regulatory domain-containing protein [Planctomycetota bacterium]